MTGCIALRRKCELEWLERTVPGRIKKVSDQIFQRFPRNDGLIRFNLVKSFTERPHPGVCNQLKKLESMHSFSVIIVND